MSTYAWIITRDHITEGLEKDVRTAGPRDATEEQIARAAKGGREFRMLDDDGELYYEGRIWTEEEGTEDDFGPLDDFGLPNAGATSIHYRIDGEWVML